MPAYVSASTQTTNMDSSDAKSLEMTSQKPPVSLGQDAGSGTTETGFREQICNSLQSFQQSATDLTHRGSEFAVSQGKMAVKKINFVYLFPFFSIPTAAGQPRW